MTTQKVFFCISAITSLEIFPQIYFVNFQPKMSENYSWSHLMRLKKLCLTL